MALLISQILKAIEDEERSCVDLGELAGDAVAGGGRISD
jgi:hypothetical protein